MLAKDGGGDEGTMSKPKIVIEDFGGPPAELYDEDHPEECSQTRASNDLIHYRTSAVDDGRA